MIPSPTRSSSFSGLGRPRLARAKVASGGLGGYTDSRFFEKPRPIRESSRFRRRSAEGASEDPFGRVTKISGDRDSLFLYTGHLWHQQSGLFLTLYRAYDPAIGRWISRDPMEEAAGLNLYAYVSNSPIHLIDPLGLDDEESDGLQIAGDASAGFGDFITGDFMNVGNFSQNVFGHKAVSITEFIRELMGTNQYVNKCSNAYKWGRRGGMVWMALAMAATGLNGGSNSVFWSGFKQGAQEAAMKLGTTIEQTEIGSLMNYAQNSLQVRIPNIAWKVASAIFAMNAKGQVQAVIRNAGEVWSTIEQPILNLRGIPIIFR